MEIKDSGTRREFESGAVRDIAEGKGRCDLMPLDVVATLKRDQVLYFLAKFVETKSLSYIYHAVKAFCRKREWDIDTCMLEVAKHYEEGCKKYGERNWEKGISLHCYLDSATRHYLKWSRGDDDEPHDRAFVWNCLGLIWTASHRPECNDL